MASPSKIRKLLIIPSCSLYQGIHYNENLLHKVVEMLNIFAILSITLGLNINKPAINIKVRTFEKLIDESILS
jgi:hypothetical protein